MIIFRRHFFFFFFLLILFLQLLKCNNYVNHATFQDNQDQVMRNYLLDYRQNNFLD